VWKKMSVPREHFANFEAKNVRNGTKMENLSL
jgi:hypothetical protein